MSDAAETLKFLEVLYRPGEVFEVRLKTDEQKGAKQVWTTYEKRQQFAEVHVPIHLSHKRHVWVGVAPRTENKSSAAQHGRVLWVDLDETVNTKDRLDKVLNESQVPAPSMIVNSGNGYHLYWILDGEYSPDEIRPHAKAVHSLLPSDSTHDPTRVMRVPGSFNFKDPENPRKCSIEYLDEDKVYPLKEFPKEARTFTTQTVDAAPKVTRTLPQEDYDLFVTNWLDGQKHHMAVGVAGYLRKTLNYNKQECLDMIASIHADAGYDWPDQNLMKVVDDTYDRPLGTVAGYMKLQEYGISPSVGNDFTFKFKQKKKPKMQVINFNEDIKPQEFWMDGLIGPGLLTLWTADAKTGKSFAVMQLGYALAKGQDIWGFRVPKPVRVLYFQGELSRGMVADRALNMFGRDSLRIPSQFAMTDKPDGFVNLVESPEVLNDLAEDYDVIIVDPISYFSANDENSTVTVRETLSVFDSLKAKGKAVVLVHHTKKLQTDREGNTLTPGFSDIRGSSGWFAAADAIALQYRLGDAGHTRVKFMFRAAPERDPVTLYRLPDGSFTNDYKNFLAESGQRTMTVPLSELN